MDDNGHRENGRHKADQYKSIHTQWMMPNHQMKDAHAHTMKFMAVMAERDKAIQERNVALSEKKAALAERDIAILQRDAAIAERNTAIMERDNAVASLEYTRENGTSGPGCPPGCSASHLTKHVNNHQQQHRQHVQSQPPQLSDAPYNRETHMSEAFPTTAVSEGVVKVRRAKRQAKTAPAKKISKPPRKNQRRGGDDLNKQVTISVTKPENEWRVEGGEDLNKQVPVKKHNEWKEQDLGLNLVVFDESMVQIPVCSCTGKYRQCYKWGNGGWQSACCTTTLSIYPLPVVPNKRHARLGGRKMSGSAFSKLLRRLAAEGHDLSKPLDLKDHWSKHGTNRYITIK